VAAKEGKRTAKQVLWVYSRFDATLVTILIAINALSVALSVFSGYLFVSWLAPLNLSEVWDSLISSVVLTLVLYLFGETIPKQIARKIPSRTASLTVYPLSFFIIILYPLGLIFRFFSLAARWLFKGKENPEMTEEDFTTVVEKNAEHGLIQKNESQIIQASFSFVDTSVEQVLTPASAMFEIDLKGLTNAQLAKAVCATKYSRIPVYYESPDQIVGVLIVKNYLAAYLQNPRISVRDYIEKPYVVTPEIRMDEMVDGFRSHHTQVALVKNGKDLLGMVTMEDVLEELVGPIGETSLPQKEIRR
jgi:putative hemolysin